MFLALAASLMFLASGCVKIYHPVSGLNQPTVLDLTAGNFQDLALTVHCPPGELVNADEARALCRKVGLLFENQGAKVTTYTSDRSLIQSPSSLDWDDTPAEGATAAEPPPTDLILELRAHRVHIKNHHLTWLMCVATFSLVPAVAEYTFHQDVIVRDGSGYLLATDVLEGRIVRYGGGGYWLGTKLTDLLWRDKGERILDVSNPHQELSADFYAQLTQVVFNAKMRRRVLERASPADDGS